MATQELLTIITFLLSLATPPSIAVPYMDLLDLDTKQVPCEVVALGMENGLISDSQITATSVWNAVLSTRHGRLNDAASWSARKNDQDQWIQIDLGKKDVVAAIATQGRRNYNQWVKTYSVSYSSNGEHFDYYKINGLVREFNGNYDKNSLVENVLSPTVTTRYVRIHPKTWYGHISLRIEVYGCSSGPCKEGEVAFGMQNGKIHDSHITASSFWSASLSPQKARLNGVASWSSSGRNNQKQWIQIDLGKERVITAIATQGRANYNQWVKTYSVSYSLNGQNFQLYLINGVKKVFYGNSDRWSIVTNVLSQPITARYIRIHPESWYGHISMRLEIYGCYSYEGPCKSGEEALGVENGKISDITASSVWNAALSTQQGRLNSRSSWSARRNDQNQWIQVDLGRKETITVIATQGRSNYNQWVKTFSVFYSLNGHTFEPYKINGIQKVFTGNTDRNSVVFNVLSPTITTRYIRIHPKTWHYHISMRLELYGCKREKETLCNLGETTLGIEDGRIGSTQLISSTVWSPSYSAARGGRLYDAGAWIALANDLNQWMQVDLGRREVVTGIATQGRSNSNQWVKTYLVSYSLDGRIFNTYQSDGVDKTFIGNTDRNTIIKNVLSPAITARYVRIHPVTWQSHISMRMELYGCFRAPKPCDSTPCKNEGICQNDGESFLCTCVGSYEGKTCEEYASPCKTHEVGLGVEKGKIPDDQLTASTSYRVALNVLHGRLNGGPSWSARQNDRNQWMQVDLGREEVVTGIATQGRNNYNQWVKTYSVSYSLDGRIFYAYESGGVGKIFIGNTDRNTIIKNVLSPAITARYVRIHPVTWQRHISMRMELYGCYRAPKPCDSSPCKNEGKCTNEGNLSFSCKCRPYFIGLTCETELPNPCQAKPCRNGGHCVVLGNHYSCRCKPEFGGVHCEHSQSLCWAHGDPHYRSFDGLTFNFMGTCEYDFAKDCSVNKLFTVRTTNKRCGWGVSCTASVKIYIASYHILMTRVRQTAIVNGLKITRFPLFRPGFQITNPSVKLLIFSSTDIGLTVSWDTSMAIKVAVSGRFREKLCSSSLCGNNNGNKFDDNKFSRNCAPPADELSCIPDSLTQPIIDKCQLMNSPSSPFKHCNSFVDPTTLISDCKYDACRCKNPLQCVCAAFASYSKQCAAIQSVVEWRFKGTYLYEPLKECAQECKNTGEIFTECGSSCAKTCRDLSSDSRCSEECVPSCQCPEGQVLDDNSRCVPVTECTCFFQEKVYQPGQSIKIGNCKTCTCNAGGMACLNDKICSSKRPCESFPCKNGGVCTDDGNKFSCECSGDYQGRTCEELKPKPCDSSPCKNNGICTNVGASFLCECSLSYKGLTCEEPSVPCQPSPCENGATCIDKADTFSCKCPPNFIGATCATELPNPCKNQPCQNNGVCVPLGNGYSCRCLPRFGGSRCQYSQSTCYAQGDPHYTSFDGKKFNFMGKCQYVFAQDCSESKLFTVFTKNQACGWGGASCTAAVTVILAGWKIQFNRAKRTAIINGVKHRNFPIVRPGFTIINPNLRSVILTAGIGLSVSWDCNMNIKVTVSGRYKNKLCSSSLCGNNNGNRLDDNQFDRKCAPAPDRLVCFPTTENKPIIEKCHLMNYYDSPFRGCNGIIDPTELIVNCKYDACRCQDQMQCVCSSFATYSQRCAAYGKVINWRFQGTYLYPPLRACAQQCENDGEIFTECGLSCARSCRDLSRKLNCNEECVSGCQCPIGQLLNYKNRCLPVGQCPCEYEGEMIEPGQSVNVGNCKTCTCSRGSLACVDDRACQTEGACESFPCKNGGVCTEEGLSFSCKCSEDYQGETCDELKPRPCDSSPCKNEGICSNEGLSYSCECIGFYQGKTCEEKKPKPCDTSPCRNGAACTNTETSFSCKCPPGFVGKYCDKEALNPCKPNPCLNAAECERLGNTFSCHCKDNTFGGPKCEYKQSLCEAHGDPHYTTFDKRRYNFQGPCSYVFAEDCSADKTFKVVTTNVKCGWGGVTCTAAVTVYLNGNEVRLTREKRAVIINRIKIRKFPVRHPDFVITNPSMTWLRLTTSFGLTVYWNSHTIVRVTVAGKYHGKMCGLCGNFNGNSLDDDMETSPQCVTPPSSLVCQAEAASKNKFYMEMCDYMNDTVSPFAACNAAVDPCQLLKDCKYDACKCDDPIQCVCKSFAAYSQQCSENGVVLKWRFQGTYLFPPLEKCAQQCFSSEEIFTECGSSCARSCRDLSANVACKEECIPGCQCPDGKLLDYAGRCVPVTQCPCEFEGKIVEAGDNVDIDECRTCTCHEGAMTCVENEECSNKGLCDSLPCKNNGVCLSSNSSSFSCNCTGDYEGETCEELKPKPCDSSPCKNDGVCTNEGVSFSCECKCDFRGKTCEELVPKPCDSSPCKNDGICLNEETSFRCKCIGIYEGKTCEDAGCKESKLDILFIVDGSGSVRKANFAKVKQFIERLNTRFHIGPEKTQVALMQFGEPIKTRIEFNLGDKKTLKGVNQGVEEMDYLRSQTATGDALYKSKNEVFNGKGNDRPDAPNVILLFTDGQATDKQGKNYQVEQAEKLKDEGVKVITVGMGERETIDKFREPLNKMASRASGSGTPLMFEADFAFLDSIANNLVEEVCDISAAG